jgi:GntR family transcriptional repressor for pyruvate dehydrogenase complex
MLSMVSKHVEPPTVKDPEPDRRSATERAIEAVVTLIGDDSIGASARLPPENDLAALIGVSRGSLREAVRVLDYLGVLDVRVGDGTYVSDLSGATLLGGLNLFGRVVNDATALEIFEIRRVIESAAAAMAATRISSDQLSELQEVLDELRAETDGPKFVQLDIRFHDLIATATGNASLRVLCASFSARTQTTRLLRSRNGSDILARSTTEHDDIFRHIQAGEPVLAAAASTSHVANVEHWLREALTAGPDPRTVTTDS